MDAWQADLDAFGRAFRYERGRRGLSQERMGQELGIDRTEVGHIERGELNLSFEYADRLAATLGSDMISLIEQGRGIDDDDDLKAAASDGEAVRSDLRRIAPRRSKRRRGSPPS